MKYFADTIAKLFGFLLLASIVSSCTSKKSFPIEVGKGYVCVDGDCKNVRKDDNALSFWKREFSHLGTEVSETSCHGTTFDCKDILYAIGSGNDAVGDGNATACRAAYPQPLKLCGAIPDVSKGKECIVRETTLLLSDKQRYCLFDLRGKDTSVVLEWFLNNVQRDPNVSRELATAYDGELAQGKSLKVLGNANALSGASQAIGNTNRPSQRTPSDICSSEGLVFVESKNSCCTGGFRRCNSLHYYIRNSNWFTPYLRRWVVIRDGTGGVRYRYNHGVPVRTIYPTNRPNAGRTRVYYNRPPNFYSGSVNVPRPTNTPNGGTRRLYGDEFSYGPVNVIRPR